MYFARLGSSTITVATPTAEPAGQLLPSLLSAEKSSCEHCCAAVTFPSRPGGSWKLRFLGSPIAAGSTIGGCPGSCTSSRVWSKSNRARQLERVRAGLRVERAAPVFRRDLISAFFDAERDMRAADLDRTRQRRARCSFARFRAPALDAGLVGQGRFRPKGLLDAYGDFDFEQFIRRDREIGAAADEPVLFTQRAAPVRFFFDAATIAGTRTVRVDRTSFARFQPHRQQVGDRDPVAGAADAFIAQIIGGHIDQARLPRRQICRRGASAQPPPRARERRGRPHTREHQHRHHDAAPQAHARDPCPPLAASIAPHAHRVPPCVPRAARPLTPAPFVLAASSALPFVFPFALPLALCLVLCSLAA